MKTIKTAKVETLNLAATYQVGDQVDLCWTAWDGRGGYTPLKERATVVKVNKVTLDLEFANGAVKRWHHYNDWRLDVKKVG